MEMKKEHHPVEGRLGWLSLFRALLDLFYSILTNLH